MTPPLRLLLLLALPAMACGAVEALPSGDDAGGIPDASSPATPGPTVSAVFLRGVPTIRQVRQGAGPTLLYLQGERLEGATVSVDDVVLAAVADDATEVVVTWEVPHGAALGPRTVVITTPAGSVTVEGALEISPIAVAQGALDGDGTLTAPYGDLADALASASDGDEVRLIGPFVLSATTTIPPRVTVAGDGAGVTVTKNGVSPSYGFVLSAGAGLRNVNIVDYGAQCVRIIGKGASVTKVQTSFGEAGIYVGSGASATLEDITMAHHTSVGLVSFGAALTVTRLTITRDGISAGVLVWDGVVEMSQVSLTKAPTAMLGPLFWDHRPEPPVLGSAPPIILRNLTMNGVPVNADLIPGPQDSENIQIANKTVVKVEKTL